MENTYRSHNIIEVFFYLATLHITIIIVSAREKYLWPCMLEFEQKKHNYCTVIAIMSLLCSKTYQDSQTQ